jgi:putative SOS response-associated peptidase YedK
MCGRYNLRANLADVAGAFDLQHTFDFEPRYNIAPTQSVPAIRRTAGGREPVLLRWGLIPSWAKDASIGNSLINARAETVAEKPAFRSAFKRRRCLIPATGFYEWQATGGKHKQPFHIRLKGEGVFAFAGLWERWDPPGGPPVESFAIITTEPNELCAGIHNRMPVILHPEDYDAWTATGEPRDTDELRGLLVPYPAGRMEAHPVSRFVSNARNEGPQCVTPLDAE